MEEKERFECKYNEKLMKHYTFDNENKEELGYKGVVRVLNQQDARIKELNEKLQDKVSDLEAKLAESEKQIKDAIEAGNMAVDSWCKNRRKYEAQIAEMQNKSFILYSMLYETLEKQGCDNVASQIDQMTGWTYDKEANWLKGNRNYDQLKQSQNQKAIEELEKVKELGFIQSYTLDVPNILILKYEDFKQLLDNQIKSLKGEE